MNVIHTLERGTRKSAYTVVNSSNNGNGYTRYTGLPWLKCLWERLNITSSDTSSKYLHSSTDLPKKLCKCACQCFRVQGFFFLPLTLELAAINLTLFLHYHYSYTSASSNNWYLTMPFFLCTWYILLYPSLPIFVKEESVLFQHWLGILHSLGFSDREFQYKTLSIYSCQNKTNDWWEIHFSCIFFFQNQWSSL